MTVNEFIKDLKKSGDYHLIFAADYKHAKLHSVRHNRLGSIPRDISAEGAGVKVAAFGVDEIGNVTAMHWNGTVRQYLGGKRGLR